MKPAQFLRPLALAPLLLLCSTHPVEINPRLVPFEPLVDTLPARVTMPVDVLMTSARQYRALFGHDAPGVDWSHEWVVLYSAGLQEGGHHVASIEQVRRTEDGHSLEISTRLVSDLCQMPPQPERPYALARLQKPAEEIGVVRFVHEFVILACGP